MKSAPAAAAAMDAQVRHVEHAGAGAPVGHSGVAAQCSGATRRNCHFPLLPHDYALPTRSVQQCGRHGRGRYSACPGANAGVRQADDAGCVIWHPAQRGAHLGGCARQGRDEHGFHGHVGNSRYW